MSDPILPLVPIAEGTTQIDIEANDNFLRLEALSRPCLGVANDAAGGDAEGDVWLVGDTPAGAFATFDENDVAIFDGIGWHAWAPVSGLRLVVDDVRKVWDGADWIDDPSISTGGGGSVTSVAVAVDASTDDVLTVSGAPITTSGTMTVTAVDPGADRILFWDDSEGKLAHLQLGTGLAIIGDTLSATGGGGSGTVTSVGLEINFSAGSVLSVSNSPIIDDGNIVLHAIDPGADRILFWDDSEGELRHLTVGAGLSISTTTLSATADVVGPVSSTADSVALFDGTTGKLLKDGAKTIAQIRQIEQNSQSSAYTLVLADAGKHILHPSADTTARTWTIPANSSVAFPIGTAITFVNQNAGGVVSIAITTDTLRLAGTGTTGTRSLAANGIATALKITSTEWIISGTGLT